MRALFLDDEKSGHLALHASRNQDRARFGGGLDARGDVWRVAEDFAGGVDHHRAGIEPDAGGKLGRARTDVPCVEVGKRPLDRKRRPHGALGVVFLRMRVAEERHQPVAELLQNVAAKSGHSLRRFIEIGVDEVAPILGVKFRGKACRADKIAKHDRDRATLGGLFACGR